MIHKEQEILMAIVINKGMPRYKEIQWMDIKRHKRKQQVHIQGSKIQGYTLKYKNFCTQMSTNTHTTQKHTRTHTMTQMQIQRLTQWYIRNYKLCIL